MKTNSTKDTSLTKAPGSLVARWTLLTLLGAAAALALGCGSQPEATEQSSQDLGIHPCVGGCGPRWENPPGTCTATSTCGVISAACSNTGNGLYYLNYATDPVGSGVYTITTSTILGQPIALQAYSYFPSQTSVQICAQHPSGIDATDQCTTAALVYLGATQECPDGGP